MNHEIWKLKNHQSIKCYLLYLFIILLFNLFIIWLLLIFWSRYSLVFDVNELTSDGVLEGAAISSRLWFLFDVSIDILGEYSTFGTLKIFQMYNQLYKSCQLQLCAKKHPLPLNKAVDSINPEVAQKRPILYYWPFINDDFMRLKTMTKINW